MAKQADNLSTEGNSNSEPYVLIGEFLKLYSDKYNKKIRVNRFKYKWAMSDLIEDYGGAKIYEVMRYYFDLHVHKHSIDFFMYNFDRLEKSMIELQKDREHRQKLREATKRMVRGEEE